MSSSSSFVSRFSRGNWEVGSIAAVLEVVLAVSTVARLVLKQKKELGVLFWAMWANSACVAIDDAVDDP